MDRLGKMVKEWEPGDQLGSWVGTVILAATATSGPCSRGPLPGPYFTGEEYEAQRDEAEPGLEPKSVQNLLLSTYSAGGGGDTKGPIPKSTLWAKIHPFFPVLTAFTIFLQLCLSAPGPPTPPFISQMWTEHVPCAKHCSRHWGDSRSTQDRQ